MTVAELIYKFNTEFGLNKWPDTYEVDADTYARACQAVFNNVFKSRKEIIWYQDGDKSFCQLNISFGENIGLLFKNVELVLKPD